MYRLQVWLVPQTCVFIFVSLFSIVVVIVGVNTNAKKNTFHMALTVVG